jgi:hypothetical protein
MELLTSSFVTTCWLPLSTLEAPVDAAPESRGEKLGTVNLSPNRSGATPMNNMPSSSLTVCSGIEGILGHIRNNHVLLQGHDTKFRDLAPTLNEALSAVLPPYAAQ